MTLIRCVSRQIFNALRHEFHLEDEDIKNVSKTYGKTLLIRNNSNPRQAPTAKDGKINLSDCCYVGFSPKEKSIIVVHSLGNTKRKEAIARFLGGQTPTVRRMVK
jgi:ATP-dependent phosphoenolpyruvate carboxykinase